MVRCFGIGISLGLLLVVAGCGPTGPKRYQVGGEVTFKENPIKLGTISFRSDAGDTALAQIVEGKYELPKEVGLPEGKYRVSISYPDVKISQPADQAPGETPPSRELIPPKYNSKSTLIADVKPTDNKDLSFKLD